MKRLMINKIALLLSILSAITGLAFLAWILITLFLKGVNSLHFSLFLHDLVDGGLKNLIFGQFLMATIATVIGVPLGLMAGIYLREYGQGRYANIIRDLSDIMMSAPSIIIGSFVFVIVVVPFGSINGWAGAIALTIMLIPIVVSTTDNMLSLVPKELREAGIALGGGKHQVILDIVLKAAKVGLMTGILLGFARIIGETAPLLFTSGTNSFWTTDLSNAFPSLSVSIYNLANFPTDKARDLAWAASFILTMIVLFINIVGRFFTREKG
ncbi:phosphate ABC transporter permease PstA [Sulfurospirillum sp. 1612]|uniref:phosphate ABC transporter permease PstA n=1 Tax=Sulfurospirillum sp. 1612 TaxID=3094835 RepID=UPI002F95E774